MPEKPTQAAVRAVTVIRVVDIGVSSRPDGKDIHFFDSLGPPDVTASAKKSELGDQRDFVH
ncbi:hypothetical protein GCM10009735_79170 [Actinomadura chokoriensis]